VPSHSLLRHQGQTRVTAVAALAVGVTLLAGCSSSTTGAASSSATSIVAAPESTSAVSTSAPSTSAASTDESAAADSNSVAAVDPSAGDSSLNAPFTANPDNIALTAAGTKLTYTQSATVPMALGADQGVITFGKLSLTQGSDADWTALEGAGYDAAGTTPWYVKLTVTVDSGSDIASDSVETNLQGFVNGQDPVYGDIALQDNSICPIAAVGDNVSAGHSYDSCIILAVPSGQSVSQILFAGDDSSYTSAYTDNPVVWTSG
jgi:hypothetical protein